MHRIRLGFLLITCGVLLSPIAAAAQQQSIGDSTLQDDELPIYARYNVLFRRLVPSSSENQSASERRAPPYQKILQQGANLSDEEISTLVQIATECMQKVAEIDGQAKEIIQTYRAQKRSGGQSPDDQQRSPPSSLKTLQQQHNDLILQAREQVRLAFGQTEFERFDRYVSSKGGGSGRRFTLPSGNKQPLPIRVTVVALNSEGIPHKQFTTGTKIFIEVKMMNDSAQAITIKPAELYDWFQLLRLEKTGAYEIGPLQLVTPSDRKQNENEPTFLAEIKAGKSAVVGRIELGGGIIKLGVGQYRCVPHETVLLNRPPDNSEFLRFTVDESKSITFEIVP